MEIAGLIPIALALGAALAYGAADFAGGLAARRADVVRVVMVTEVVAAVAVLPFALMIDGDIPDVGYLAYGALAGVFGSVGIILLYRALAIGQMSIAAPVSALPAVVVPVLVGIAWGGLPSAFQLAGFLLALAAVWLVSMPGNRFAARPDWSALWLPLLSGVALGGYFVALHLAGGDTILWPLFVSYLAATAVAAGYLAVTGRMGLPGRGAWTLTVTNGVLGALANVLFMAASVLGRLDVAAVLSSLYPGVTVVMASARLHERIGTWQRVGIVCALVAIVLIAA